MPTYIREAELTYRRWLALGAGLGGGGSAGGGFIGPDAFFVVAYENPHFVPFLSGRCAFSAPIGARAVDVSEAGMQRKA